MQITTADRCALLDSFRKLAKEWAGDDSVLIAGTTRWAADLRPTFGFECSLGRDVFFLCDTLRNVGPAGEAAELARGGLAFLHQNNRIDPLPLGSLGLLDDAFVAGYAAHAVREKLGEPARYSPPQLRPEEKARAEGLFLELLDRSADEDDGLPARAQEALGQLGHLLESGLFRRLRLNVQFLSGVLRDSGRPADHRQIARAALHYVALENDVIPDHLGLIGFLDDYFVADLAVGLIDDGRPPWLSLVDATVGAWPFLNMVVFEDGGGGIPLSEFLLVNTALACPAVRGADQQPLTHLILPRTGPLPLLLGFLASLGVLWKARAERGDQIPFQPGQKVLVDGKAVRTFVGCRLGSGRMEFGLGKTYRDRGQELQSIVWWAIDQLHRLTPADGKRAARGRLSVTAGRDEPLRALDYLFLSAEPVTVPPDMPHIVVSAQIRASKETAEAVSLFGQKLTDAIPIGHLTSAGEVCHWSPRFGSSRPAVLVVPDLDRACEYVEEEGEKVSLTVVDATGHNAGRTASLARLRGLGAKVLVVTSQAEAGESLTDDTDSTIWEWSRGDFESLFTEASGSDAGDRASPIRRYEREVVRALSAGVEVVRVHTTGVLEAFQAVTALEEAVEARGEEVPPELDNALDLSFNVLTRLLRCPFRLADHPRLMVDLYVKLDALAGTMAVKAFLTAQEVQAVDEAECRLRALCELLRRDNPKADALSQLRLTSGPVTLVCGDADLLEDVDGLTVCPVTTALDLTPCGPDGSYAIAGWFGRGTMTRLLRPPFASPLRLILYEIEAEWHQVFSRRTQREAVSRRVRASRSRLFPGIRGWTEPAGEPSEGGSAPPETPVGDPLDKVETRLVAGRRGRLTALARPSAEETAVEARLVLFDGGHAFLTDEYKAKVATHLLDPSTDQGEAELELVPARQLRRGDVLLFLRGSARDVIREVADKLLPPGERERAGLWRAALLKYRQQADCPTDVVWRRLQQQGCPLSLAAIRNWFEDDDIISPVRVDRELQSILGLTQDPDLRDGLTACREAITRVRGAHLRASKQLARRVLDTAVAGLKSSRGGAVDLGEGIVLVRVTGVDEALVRVKATAANRFVEG